MRRYVTMGIDEEGQVYGLELAEGGGDGFRVNPLGLSTSCVVIRPVSSDTMAYYQGDRESVREWWQVAVSDGQTELGLEDFFKEKMGDDGRDGVWYDESWPGKDESWCHELLEDPENPTLKAGGFKGDDFNGGDFRKHVEKLILDSEDIDLDRDGLVTWEASGCWPPEKPFLIELAPREYLDAYYAHLVKTVPKFKENWKR